MTLLSGILSMFLSSTCTPPETPAERRAVYATVRQTCAEQQVAHHVCEAAVAVTWRESRGNPCARHTRGKNEDGDGLHGMSYRFWGWTVKALGQGRKPFQDPRLGTLALFREWQYAVRRGADSLRDLQRVHSGLSPRDDSHPWRDNRFCHLLRTGPRDDQHVVSWDSIECYQAVTAQDLGPRLDDQRMVTLASKEK